MTFDDFLEIRYGIAIRIHVAVPTIEIVCVRRHGIQPTPALTKIGNEVLTAVPRPSLVGTGVRAVEETA